MKQDILALLQEVLPAIDFTSSEFLVDEGILDSLSLMTIISELSVEYGISIPYGEIVPQNFNSLDSITMLVKRLMKC